MKKKDRFLSLDELKSMAQAIGKGSAVSVVIVCDRDGKSFCATSGKREHVEEILRDALEAVLLQTSESEPPRDDEPEKPSVIQRPKLILP